MANGGGTLPGDSITSPSSASEICRILAVEAGEFEAPDDLLGCSVFTSFEGTERVGVGAGTTNSIAPDASGILREPLEGARLIDRAEFGEGDECILASSAAARGDKVASSLPSTPSIDCGGCSELTREASIKVGVGSVRIGDCVFCCEDEVVELDLRGDPAGRIRITGGELSLGVWVRGSCTTGGVAVGSIIPS